ncbi:HNH endonuclease [Flavobacterium psychrophilum]
MRTFIFILFSALIGYLTKDVWVEINPWYYKAAFLSVIILIPFILYSIAAEIALETGWFGGLLTMIIIMVFDNYLTNAMSLCIISKSHRGFFDYSGFALSFQLLKLPWYSYVVCGIMGLITGAIGDKQREIEREKEQKALWLGVYLLAGQFLGMAVPEMTPIISRVTPIVTTVLTAEVATKTSSLAISETSKLADKNVLNKTEPVIIATAEETTESVLKVKYFEHSYIKNGKTKITNIPNFTKQSVFETELPSNLQIAPDKAQFTKATSLYNEQLLKNPKLLDFLKNTNREMLKQDLLYFEKNKTKILEAQTKMLEATKSNNLVEEARWLKELRQRTQKITFIHTPKGKPFVLYNEDEILAKQLKDICNSNSNNQGRIFGYIWHHTEKNALQLVRKDVHEFNPHTGGNSICGGGVR